MIGLKLTRKIAPIPVPMPKKEFVRKDSSISDIYAMLWLMEMWNLTIAILNI